MSLPHHQAEWQRHYAIEQAVAAYFDLELRFPNLAQLASSGQFNLPPAPGYMFKEGDEADADNGTLLMFLRASAAIISQIYYASRDNPENTRNNQAEIDRVIQHGDRAIRDIVGRLWNSLRIFSNLFDNYDLEKEINVLVEQLIDLDKTISEFSESSNA